MYTGPNIERNGLVFGYDTGYGVADNSTSTRFYPGKNTNNLISNSFDPTFDSLSDGNTCGFINQLGTGNYLGVSSIISHKGTKSLKINRGTGGTGRVYRTLSLTLGQYLSVSCWVYSTTPGAILTLEYNGGDYNWGVAQTRNTHTGTGWEYLYVRSSSPATSNTTAYYFLYPSVQNQDTYWDNIQAENSQYPSPFLTGTRSSTQSLIDLTRTTTIDVSNVSFDSTGQPTFDGTDDYASLSSNIFNNTLPNFSISVWYKNSGGGILLGNHFHGSIWESVWFSTTLFIVNGANNSTTNRQSLSYSSPPLNTWNNLIAINNSSEGVMKIYLNGTEYASKNATVIPWNSNIIPTIGAQLQNTGQIVGPINGNISQVAVYSRALSTQEIQQNYRAYKNRFDI